MKARIPCLVLVAQLTAGCAVAPVSSEISWNGWIINDVPGTEVEVLSEGRVVVTTPDGTPISEGEQPSENSPGLWQLTVDPDTDVGLRVSGTGIHPTVWRVRTPPASGWWMNGALFGIGEAGLDPMLELVEELKGELIQWRDDPDQGVLIYGQPRIETATDLAAWTGASVTVVDQDYHEGRVALITVDEAGIPALASDGGAILGPNEVEGPVTFIIAWDLAPGPIRMIVDASDGRAMVSDWNGEGGDVLSAFHLTLPSVLQ